MSEAAMVSGAAPIPPALNPEQSEAVRHLGSPLLVIAGPGSGKTRVITRRMAYRIAGGVPARRVLGVTFTQRAAREMKQRLQAESDQAAGAHIGTFHWMCQALLRRYAGHAGHRTDFHLLSPSEARRIRQSLVIAAGSKRQQFLMAIAAVKNGLDLPGASRRYAVIERELAQVLASYEARLRALGAFDLDDLLSVTVALLGNNEDVRERCQARFDEIVVDEYQDTSPLQQELLVLLVPHSRCLMAVGDEDQAIYSWRQATDSGVEAFQRRFPDARIIELRDNYRSTKLILRAATSLIAHNLGRTPKDLRTTNGAGDAPTCYAALDERDEADWVAAEIRESLARETIDSSEVGVLYRTNIQARALEDALVRAEIPYHVFAGRRFYEREDVRAVVAFIRLALDARDERAAEFLLRQVPGIGERRLERVLEIGRNGVESYRNILTDETLPLPANVRLRVQTLARMIDSVTERRHARLSELAAAAVYATTSLLLLGPTEESGFSPLDELRAVIDEVGARRGTARDFVDRIALGESSDSHHTGVSLLSLHSAKGLEFSSVFITGLEEGLLPHRRSLDTNDELQEERRLCYVGVTRARRRLYMSYAQTRMLGGNALSGTRSRFITEMGKSNVTLKTSPLLATKPRLSSVLVGEQVYHPRWQTGTVVQVDGVGRDTLVTIEFPAIGLRRLQLCHTPLTRQCSAMTHD